MGFKNNVLFYLNEAKKDKDYEEKRKVCAGDEADGSSVKTEKHKGAYTGSEACMASKKTEKRCTGSEASDCTEKADKLADKEANKVTYGAVAKRNRMMQDNQDYLDRYVDTLAKKKKKTLSAASTEDANTVSHVEKKYKEKYGEDAQPKFSFNQEWNKKQKPKKSYDKDEVPTVSKAVEEYEEPKPGKGKKKVANSEKVKDIAKEASKYYDEDKTEKTKTNKKVILHKKPASCKTEEAAVIAAYDQRKFKVQKETNEVSKDSKMKGYDIGKMSGVSNGRKPSMDKYNDYGETRAEVDPETNEIAKDKKMEGFSLKEEIGYYSGNVISEEVLLNEEQAELLNESIKNKSASKKLLKVSKKMELAAAKVDDKELHDVLVKNAKMFRQAYSEVSAAEDAYKSGDVAAKQKYKKLTKKYADQFKTVNKGKIGKLIGGGFGVAAIITLVAGSVLLGIQGIYEPTEQLEGIAKLTINSPLDGIKHFFGFGKKIVANDVNAVKNFFGTKDFTSVKTLLSNTSANDKNLVDTLQNGVNARSKTEFATSGKGEVVDSIKNFMSKMGKKGTSDEGDSMFKYKNI